MAKCNMTDRKKSRIARRTAGHSSKRMSTKSRRTLWLWDKQKDVEIHKGEWHDHHPKITAANQGGS